jgi:hypothetical protein
MLPLYGILTFADARNLVRVERKMVFLCYNCYCHNTNYNYWNVFINSFTDACSPGWTFGLPFRGFFITHIQRHGRTPLDDLSARRRDLYLHRTTQHINKKDKHPCPSGIRTRDPSNQATAHLRLRPLGLLECLSSPSMPMP